MHLGYNLRRWPIKEGESAGQKWKDRRGRNAKTQVLEGGGCVKMRDNVVNLKKMSTKPNFV
jgi:hypothetical protein